MTKFTISLLAAFVISLSAVPAPSLDFSQALGLRSSLFVSRAEGYGFKTQGGSLFDLTTSLTGENFGVAATVGYHSVGASNLAEGYAYRGFVGLHCLLGAEWYPLGEAETQRIATGPAPRPGASIGVGGFFSRYQYTDLLFFYPALQASLFSDFYFPASLFRVRFALPAEVYFRRDLAASFSVGFGAWGILSWTRLAGRFTGGEAR